MEHTQKHIRNDAFPLKSEDIGDQTKHHHVSLTSHNLTIMAAPTRIALIGLSSNAKAGWASGAHLPYLLSPRGQAKFRIVALLNSSVQAAKDAIATYNLPSPETIKAYGTPEDLASDPDVDLVVNSTRVDNHYKTILPSIQKGKDVFVEWPLAHDIKHVRELVELAKEKGQRTVVGAQGRLGPLAQKLREVIDSGKIGKVVSSEVRASGGTNARDRVPVGLKYFTERKVGGNFYTIMGGHLMDMILSILGDYDATEEIQGSFHLQHPIQNIFDPATQEVVGTTKSDVPDLAMVQGRLQESEKVQKGAILSLQLRRGSPFPSEPALVWLIHGERGAIRVVSHNSTNITIGTPNDAQVFEVLDYETTSVEKVEWAFEDWQEELPRPARNIGAIYEEYAAVKENGGKPRYQTFEQALKRHEQLDEPLSKWTA
ncbi:NAD(P)-binding protein [Podospora fimiseda]|uniref:NAD(P)-binding protein n=1 Tax=Podospora fimiseda TaxID=252190 RepID=A0AAN6YP85_9PEZI|nr:NAD(P)-binding protein [Podospora fimiseda]